MQIFLDGKQIPFDELKTALNNADNSYNDTNGTYDLIVLDTIENDKMYFVTGHYSMYG